MVIKTNVRLLDMSRHRDKSTATSATLAALRRGVGWGVCQTNELSDPRINMSSSIPIPEIQKYRSRAIQYRMMAELFRLQSARNHLLKIAADYERMALEGEQRKISQGISAAALRTL
jgi:hypothetical protein